jgi:quercetin dioxygenase-like cupin family protein
MRTPILACVAAGIAATVCAGSLQAQQPAGAEPPQTAKRTFLQTFDVPGGDYETIIGMSEFAPNASIGRHSHPGPEGGYVLQGGGAILVDGQPPLALKAGQSYKVAPGVAHDVRSGAEGMKLIVTWVVEKGKPFASPAK